VICGTTHKTVRRVVEAHEASCAGLPRPPGKDRGRNYDGVRDLVAEKVRKSQGRSSAKRLLPTARAAGYAGSARNFRRLVAEVKAGWRAGHHPRPPPGGVDAGRQSGHRLGSEAGCACSAR
jgi:hypothetical protein